MIQLVVLKDGLEVSDVSNTSRVKMVSLPPGKYVLRWTDSPFKHCKSFVPWLMVDSGEDKPAKSANLSWGKCGLADFYWSERVLAGYCQIDGCRLPQVSNQAMQRLQAKARSNFQPTRRIKRRAKNRIKVR